MTTAPNAPAMQTDAAAAGIGHNQPPEPIQIERVKIRLLPDGRMTRRDAAKYLGVAVKTVAMWDLEDPSKLGSVKVGGRRFYYMDRLDQVIRGEIT